MCLKTYQLHPGPPLEWRAAAPRPHRVFVDSPLLYFKDTLSVELHGFVVLLSNKQDIGLVNWDKTGYPSEVLKP